MSICNDNFKDERCRMTLLPSSSSSISTNFYIPITTVNMQPNRAIHNSHIHYHDKSDNDDNSIDNNRNNDNNGDDDEHNANDSDSDDGNDDSNGNSKDNIGIENLKQNDNGSFFDPNYHYLQIDRNSINILLKVAAAFVLLSIAGCLVLQHLRINRLDYRIRRIELNSAYSIQVRLF
ncbi:hypothetical protein WUBG_03840 [Wuchereria bancrofti]|uniref:Uncharacterized protein n=1 Tax=Wuchereria bancrofti TaxID=6293 RepID=J9ERT7_WUCBA|nr:hypothetical protein WUBG_03840 [Wuchereria bancrofti]VDM09187.1 unnamed protein product [Wuchereria bancrofti]